MRILFLFLIFIFATGCSTTQYSQNLKMLAFDKDISEGKPLGPIAGEDCSWTILGFKGAGHPKIDRAFIQAIRKSPKPVRYISSIVAKSSSWSALLFGKTCIEATGVAFQ